MLKSRDIVSLVVCHKLNLYEKGCGHNEEKRPFDFNSSSDNYPTNHL